MTMLDYKDFVSRSHSMLIAPAGYGKTHTIAECLKHTYENGKQLILTHTHAGISSIKEKIKKEGIPSKNYHVETITSFAQKYVLAFYTGTDIPEQSDSANYYAFIIEKAIDLFKLKPVRNTILSSYSGLFVDEYQDCTAKQHSLILILSELFPTRILGDYLQGIFGFNGESLVNMESSTEMNKFMGDKFELHSPQRWLNGNNAQLGADLKEIRQHLIDKKEIDIATFKSIEVVVVNELDLYDPRRDYYKHVNTLLAEKDLLIIHSDSTSVNPRVKLIKQFNNRISLVESIDAKEFYALAKYSDSITTATITISIKELCSILFNKTGVGAWFNDKGFKNKTKPEDKARLQPILEKVKKLESKVSFLLISEVLKEIKALPEIKCYRKELVSSLFSALEEAEYSNISVYDSMVNKRNSVRRMGRKIYGKCIGTTLLTKGLEFDTVVIINAHKFDCPKHLYVALTRASKRLVIFTSTSMLNPFKNN